MLQKNRSVHNMFYVRQDGTQDVIMYLFFFFFTKTFNLYFVSNINYKNYKLNFNRKCKWNQN